MGSRARPRRRTRRAPPRASAPRIRPRYGPPCASPARSAHSCPRAVQRALQPLGVPAAGRADDGDAHARQSSREGAQRDPRRGGALSDRRGCPSAGRWVTCVAIRTRGESCESYCTDRRRRCGGSGPPERSHPGSDPRPGIRRPGRGGSGRQDDAPPSGSRRTSSSSSPGSSCCRTGASSSSTLINDDKNTHCAVLPSNGDYQFIWLVNHSKGTATLDARRPGLLLVRLPYRQRRGPRPDRRDRRPGRRARRGPDRPSAAAAAVVQPPSATLEPGKGAR